MAAPRRRQPIALTALAVLLCVAADPPEPVAVRRERLRFHGTWKITALEKGGRPFPLEKEVKNARFIAFDGTKVILTRGDGSKVEEAYTPDPAPTPKTFTMTATDHDPQDNEDGKRLPTGRWHGVYEFDGKRLRLCLVIAEQKRPTRFDSRVSPDAMLVTLEREKK